MSAPRLLSPRTRRSALAALVVAACAAAPRAARSDGILAGSDFVPVEQRVAIAVDGGRSTTWSSLRFDGPGGTVAVVVPVKAGSSLDYSSRAFFEALEEATAVRVVPPDQKPAVCVGQGTDATFSVEGELEGPKPLEPEEFIVLPSSVDVQAWAAQAGLIVDPTLVAGLNALDGDYSFAVLRYTAPAGPQTTRTFRAVAPTPTPALPLVLSTAGKSDLRIIAWQLGAQRARLSGVEVAIDPDQLSFRAGDDTSNYRALVDAALSDPSRYAVESSSHFALASSASLFDGTASIRAVTDAYFTRALDAGDATGEVAACTFKAATALAQSAAFGHACPRGDLGSVGPAEACAETPGSVDAGALACGGVTDDFSIAFSDLVASDTWVTRTVLRLAPHQSGLDAAVTFGLGAPVDPVVEAAKVDASGCSSSSSSTGSGPPPSTSGGGTIEVPVYQHEGCDCSGNYVLIGYEDVPDTGDAPSAYYDDGSDGCSGSPNDSLYTNTPEDDCAYDPGTSSDSSGCDCSSDADAGGCDDSGDYGDDCASDAGGDACSSSGDACSGFDASGCDCAVAEKHVARKSHARPRRAALPLSPLVYGTALLVIPLRRRNRARSSGAGEPAKLRTAFRRAARLLRGLDRSSR